MTNRNRTLTGLTILLYASIKNPCAAAEPVDSKIVLHVEDFASLVSPTLADAANEVTGVFMQAGVHVKWTSGRRPVNAPRDGQAHVEVQILNHQMVQRKSVAEDIPANVLGQAARQICRVSIFYDRVADLTHPQAGSEGEILGRVIAHEIGHLFLPDHTHSDNGIMRGTFDCCPRLPPLFTVNETRIIQSVVAERRQCAN